MMKVLIVILSLTSGMAGVTPCHALLLGEAKPQGIDFDKLVKCISQVESNNNPKAVNKKSGALGQYQFMPKTWKEVITKLMKQPQYQDFKYAINPIIARQACEAYLHWIEKALQNHKLASLDNIIQSYNAGIGTVIRYKGNVPYRKRKSIFPKSRSIF